jgi:hypothetical protein
LSILVSSVNYFGIGLSLTINKKKLETGLNILFSNRYMFRSYDHTPLEDVQKNETCIG